MEQMKLLLEKLDKVRAEVKKVVIGKDDVIDAVLTTILSGGHTILEDIPGVGKTTLALAFSKTLSLSYKRMQFTPDVLPADVTGFSMFDKNKGEFVFHEGAVMCNLFLADEINRTSPKTQSALLEVMEEGRVTVDSVSYTVPKPFFVIATMNPLGSAGTQKMPESQLDRFMTKLSMGYPDVKSEALILKNENKGGIDSIEPVVSLDEIVQMQSIINDIYVDDAIYDYISLFLLETRNDPMLRTGVSPRGGKAVLRLARSKAFLSGRKYVVPEDIIDVVPVACCHRITLSAKARAEGKTENDVVMAAINRVAMPKSSGKSAIKE
ncbi:MAG: MoxR family ATPase [Clostridiales bacterium]|nr:MoxR family ATPase [Clostridiales bacterium]